MIENRMTMSGLNKVNKPWAMMLSMMSLDHLVGCTAKTLTPVLIRGAGRGPELYARVDAGKIERQILKRLKLQSKHTHTWCANVK